ncbi:6-carboxytetrahydropterin synthase QueD [Candidatus Peregrinibacteria bacterium]|nr:6-carboxytetrahydropterin synthase QueD [Candidatus Peregrinibacteria bacterium]
MPKLKLSTILRFSSSHFLTPYHGKCEKLHGHNYKLIVTIKDDLKENNMVLDFKKMKKIIETTVIDKLDHSHLNDTFDNPSAEAISIWIWNELKNKLPLNKITLYETEDYFCEYEGE